MKTQNTNYPEKDSSTEIERERETHSYFLRGKNEKKRKIPKP